MKQQHNVAAAPVKASPALDYSQPASFWTLHVLNRQYVGTTGQLLAADFYMMNEMPETPPVRAEIRRVFDRSLAVMRAHREAGTLRGSDGKHSERVIAELAAAGFWGLLVDRRYGGSGCGLREFFSFLTVAAVIDAPLAGVAVAHGCIGAIDPLQTFGTAAQQERWLPALAQGKRLSAFASTEPGAGSDLSAIRMTAVRNGDYLRLTGQKALITNLAPGRTIGLLCLFEGQLAVVVVDLPEQETEQFRLLQNPLHPLRHTINQGMQLRDFVVPYEALLAHPAGSDGRAIVFHGLNRGRAAICALAAGHLRVLLAGMLSWAKERRIRNTPLGNLQLIQSRLGKIAALIVGCDAFAQSCGELLDAGISAEVDCMAAKVFGSESVKQAAFDLALPTHGGRFFLQGHMAGDRAYDYLAPCIYEGENDLLCLAIFRSLAKRGEQQMLYVAGSNPGQLLQTECIAAVRRFINQTALSLISEKPVRQNPLEHAAANLLELQLKRQLGGGWPDRSELLTEVELGQQLLDGDPTWLGDPPQFADPLSMNRE